MKAAKSLIPVAVIIFLKGVNAFTIHQSLSSHRLATRRFVSHPLPESNIPFFATQPTSETVVKDTKVDIIDGLEGLEANELDGWVFQMNKLLIDSVYNVISNLYPVEGTERDYVRFYVLETVARVPYFAYLSVMHLQETLGLRYETMSDRMWMHYAEADNELHHLLIMEELLEEKVDDEGVVVASPLYWWDKALAQTMALAYFWYVIVAFIWNQAAAYHLSELIEDHAFNTYDNFLKENEERLKELPVTDTARQYYEYERPLMLGDESCRIADTPASLMSEPVGLSSLYDVFVNIRNDEKDHWTTLCNLVQFNEMRVIDGIEVKSTRPRST